MQREQDQAQHSQAASAGSADEGACTVTAPSQVGGKGDLAEQLHAEDIARSHGELLAAGRAAIWAWEKFYQGMPPEAEDAEFNQISRLRMAIAHADEIAAAHASNQEHPNAR